MNEELIELRNRLLIGIAVALVFCIPFLFIFINKFGYKPSKVLESLNEESKMVLLITGEECDNCRNTENILKENDVKYSLLNKDREIKYKEILRKIEVTESDVIVPTVIYIDEGKIYSSLAEPNVDELLSFIDFYELSSSK